MANQLNCLRCGAGMQFIRREKFQLGQTGWVLGDLPNLFAGAMEIEIYVCPKCGKLEFFQPGSDKFAGTADEAKTGSGYLPPDAPGGLPRKKCPPLRLYQRLLHEDRPSEMRLPHPFPKPRRRRALPRRAATPPGEARQPAAQAPWILLQRPAARPPPVN